MIRFSCPQCQRAYELPNALTGLPLLCKGCGSRLAVPEPQPDPVPAPPAPVSAPPPAPPTPNFARTLPEPAPPPPPPAAVATLEPEPPGPTSNGKYLPTPPAEEPSPPAAEPPAPSPPPESGSRLGPIIVDVAAGLALVGLGSIVGEMVAKKSASQILSAAMTAPKFPPMDLLLWGSGPVLAGLLYLWLGTRGWTLGGWVRRKSG